MNGNAPFYHLNPTNANKALTIRNVFDWFTLSNTPYTYDIPSTTTTTRDTVTSSSADTLATTAGENDVVEYLPDESPPPPPASISPTIGFGLVGMVGGWLGGREGGGSLWKSPAETTKQRLRGSGSRHSLSSTLTFLIPPRSP